MLVAHEFHRSRGQVPVSRSELFVVQAVTKHRPSPSQEQPSMYHVPPVPSTRIPVPNQQARVVDINKPSNLFLPQVKTATSASFQRKGRRDTRSKLCGDVRTSDTDSSIRIPSIQSNGGPSLANGAGNTLTKCDGVVDEPWWWRKAPSSNDWSEASARSL